MNTVLFDLDGTLLPIDMNEFMEYYIMLLKTRLKFRGYEADIILPEIFKGVDIMTNNNGLVTNEVIFWEHMSKLFLTEKGRPSISKRRKFEKEMFKFYDEDFHIIQFFARPDDYAAKCVKLLKDKGYQVICATNPLFPRLATENRIRWAGLEPGDFDYITTYENSCYTKPNINYYKHLLKMIDKDPKDCIMVGNDIDEDMCVEKIGMDTYLIDKYILNKHNKDIEKYKKGDFKDLYEYIKNLRSY